MTHDKVWLKFKIHCFSQVIFMLFKFRIHIFWIKPIKPVWSMVWHSTWYSSYILYFSVCWMVNSGLAFPPCPSIIISLSQIFWLYPIVDVYTCIEIQNMTICKLCENNSHMKMSSHKQNLSMMQVWVIDWLPMSHRIAHFPRN